MVYVVRDTDKKELQTDSRAPRAPLEATSVSTPDSRIRLLLSRERPHATSHASMRDKTVPHRLRTVKAARFHVPFSAL